MANKILSFDEFLAGNQIEYAEVPIQAGVVRIASITAKDWVQWTELRETPEGKKISGAMLIVRSLVDANGVRIGDDAKLAQVQELNLRTTEALLKAIFALNGINQPERKNESGEALRGASPTV